MARRTESDIRALFDLRQARFIERGYTLYSEALPPGKGSYYEEMILTDSAEAILAAGKLLDKNLQLWVEPTADDMRLAVMSGKTEAARALFTVVWRHRFIRLEGSLLAESSCFNPMKVYGIFRANELALECIDQQNDAALECFYATFARSGFWRTMQNRILKAMVESDTRRSRIRLVLDLHAKYRMDGGLAAHNDVSYLCTLAGLDKRLVSNRLKVAEGRVR